MKLSTLIAAVPGVIAQSDGDPDITAVPAEDSRTIEPGAVFVARPGDVVDGHDYIEAAVANGAAAVVGERARSGVGCSVPYVQLQDAGLALAYLSAVYFDFPARQLTMIGVTGTDGKTTTSSLIYSILKTAGVNAGMISTINAVLGDEEIPTGLHVTTPTAPEIQGYLRQMLDAGLTHVVLETTSHGWAQHRTAACDFDVAVVTNIQHEHLDFHGTWENYRDAKAMLFRNLMNGFHKEDGPKVAVINLDDEPSADYLISIPAEKQLTYGFGKGDVQALEVVYGPDATHIDVQFPDDEQLTVDSHLVGAFNVSNTLAAIAAGYGLGFSLEDIKAGVEAVEGVSGRMERINEGQDFLAVVDFAHTPNALKRALEAARLMIAPDNSVIVVFGSAGLRDPEKRAMMGEIASRHADYTVITAEDPRTESLDAILAASAEAAVKAGGVEGETFWRVSDRGRAIHFATTLAEPGDIVLACGKGHEQSMCFETTEYPWDDREAMRAALNGQPLLTLPTAE